jgi:uncharacterized UBP type Zn finger protein
MNKITDTVRKLFGGKSSEKDICEHVSLIQEVVPSGEGCKECLELGDTWVHLRLCLSCGQVGCCDNSKNKHATKHYYATEHPLIMSFEPDEDWVWCYVDRTTVG